jgi:hypothetical protein
MQQGRRRAAVEFPASERSKHSNARPPPVIRRGDGFGMTASEVQMISSGGANCVVRRARSRLRRKGEHIELIFRVFEVRTSWIQTQDQAAKRDR